MDSIDSSLLETLHLLSSPVNAERLQRSIDDARAGRATAHELVDPDAEDR